MINGLTLLLWFVGMAMCYLVGYLHGQGDELEKRNKEVKVLNDYLRSAWQKDNNLEYADWKKYADWRKKRQLLKSQKL